MTDYKVLDLELRLRDAEDRCRKQKRVIEELFKAVRDYEDWYWSVSRAVRPPARRRLLPRGRGSFCIQAIKPAGKGWIDSIDTLW